jgi:hypothetical protein
MSSRLAHRSADTDLLGRRSGKRALANGGGSVLAGWSHVLPRCALVYNKRQLTPMFVQKSFFIAVFSGKIERIFRK